MHKYNEIRETYLAWILTPPGEREPKTKKDFAAAHDINRSTLYEWENTEQFQEELKKLIGLWGVRQYSDVLNKLMEIVMTAPPAPAVSAAKVLLAHISRLEGQEDEGELTSDAFTALKENLKEKGFAVLDE